MINVPTIYDPVLQLMPSNLEFGDVLARKCATTWLTITNFNGRHLRIVGIRFGGSTDPGFSFPEQPIFPLEVRSEGSIDLEVTFCPTRAGHASGSIEIFSDDPIRTVARVPLHGVAV
jgi:hypothetical protein